MSKLKKIKIACWGIRGYIMAFVSLFLPKHKLNRASSDPNVIVSVTSYGRRVRKALPVVLRSLLLQRRAPNRIVVWVDSTVFSEDNLPRILCRMRKRYGIELFFCHDVRSYTKLVPSLMEFPNDIIITVDDDQYYNPRMVSTLLDMYERYPGMVICSLGNVPSFDSNGQLMPYNSWKRNVCTSEEQILFPLGVGGVLYPPRVLHEDTVNDSLFLKLSPYADDIWFWVMGFLNGTRVHLADARRRLCYPIDLFDQLLHKGHSLMDINMRENKNDIQIMNVFNHYGIEAKKNDILKRLRKEGF